MKIRGFIEEIERRRVATALVISATNLEIELLPPLYDALREIVNHGGGLGDIWLSWVILAAWVVAGAKHGAPREAIAGAAASSVWNSMTRWTPSRTRNSALRSAVFGW